MQSTAEVQIGRYVEEDDVSERKELHRWRDHSYGGMRWLESSVAGLCERQTSQRRSDDADCRPGLASRRRRREAYPEPAAVRVAVISSSKRSGQMRRSFKLEPATGARTRQHRLQPTLIVVGSGTEEVAEVPIV